MTDDIKKIFDFCEFRKNMADKNLERVGETDALLQTQFVAEGTAYWAVQQFILENFDEKE